MQLPIFGTDIQNETGVDVPSGTHLDEMLKTLKSLGPTPIVEIVGPGVRRAKLGERGRDDMR